MSAAGNRTGVTHSVQKLLLILPGVFPGKFHFDVQSLTVRDTMTHDVTLAVMAHVHDSAVLGVELAYRVVPSDAAVLTEGYDNLVL